ncbi:hypothetical protein DRW42_03225 [Pedobacter miscanthi]|uniref:Uncharacterized protein n=1 Tax=Pedobacter miscanthi TaxID=2259170 RepID=A0A366LDC2_9SPHI|nr:hypothetical protein DRW42_03225 [Pedobacter miscanthi]
MNCFQMLSFQNFSRILLTIIIRGFQLLEKWLCATTLGHDVKSGITTAGVFQQNSPSPFKWLSMIDLVLFITFRSIKTFITGQPGKHSKSKRSLNAAAP